MDVMLKYGCPKCSPRQVETGEFTQEEVWIEDPESLFQALWRRFRRRPRPRHQETRRIPKTERVYPTRNLKLVFSRKNEEKAPYTCPFCRTHWEFVELLSEDGVTQWQWVKRYPSGGVYVETFSVRNCSTCGGRLCSYSLGGGEVQSRDCRSCGAGAFNSSISGQYGLTWGPRE